MVEMMEYTPYSTGAKYCSDCTIYLFTPSNYCPCYRRRLRIKPNGKAVSESLTTEAVPLDNWTTYMNNDISFDYPSDWEVEEKQNRFDTAADVSVSDGSAKFFVLKLDNAKSKLFKSFGLADSVKALEEAAARDGSTNIIEETDVTKYKIGGERTGTFLSTKTDETDPYALQIFIVSHNGKTYSLGFRETTSTFDDPETQSILNKIVQSFKFLT